MFGLIAISRPKKSFKISNRCIIKNSHEIVTTRDNQIIFVVNIECFLFIPEDLDGGQINFPILNISHSSFANNHNIPDPLTRGGGGVYLAPGRTWTQPGHRPIVIVTRRTNPNNIIRADKYIQPQLQLLRAHHPFLS